MAHYGPLPQYETHQSKDQTNALKNQLFEEFDKLRPTLYARLTWWFKRQAAAWLKAFGFKPKPPLGTIVVGPEYHENIGAPVGSPVNGSLPFTLNHTDAFNMIEAIKRIACATEEIAKNTRAPKMEDWGVQRHADKNQAERLQ